LSNAYDGFLLDEAQDSNPVTIKIFNALQGQKILVGDKYQQIYQFRGSLNAMEMINAKYEFFLTHTFRCSKSVVDEGV
jgi:superfamily I DNA/RNA helicase